MASVAAAWFTLTQTLPLQSANAEQEVGAVHTGSKQLAEINPAGALSNSS